ncbi:MAG TPA: hypothetical protein VGE90_03355 [Chitinophaga sp.]
MIRHLYCYTVLFLCLLFSKVTAAQHLLEKKLAAFSVQQASPEEALRKLGEQAKITFSYQTDILESGPGISLSAQNICIGQLLQQLFGDDYEYSEQEDFIIVTKRSSYFIITGLVTDKVSGMPMDSVQVATSYRAFAVTTDKSGAFRMKVPVNHPMDHINAIKDLYRDAFVPFRTAKDQRVHIQMQLSGIRELPEVTRSADAEAGAKKVRVHPLFNIRSGSTGFEASGIFNINEGNAYNFQLAGAVNVVGKSLKGVQIAGIHNLVRDTASGMQLAAMVNKTNGPVKGVQLAVVNQAYKLKGLQIGVINIADSSEGVSLGLLNFVRNGSGYHSLSLFTNDVTNTNLAVKLGNSQLYTVFMGGMHISPDQQLYTLGIGLGHDILIGKRAAISMEANYQFVKISSWDSRLMQVKTALNVRVLKGFNLFAGPTYNRYTNGEWEMPPGYKDLGVSGYKDTRTWIGWQAGITATDLLWPQGRHYVYKERQWSAQVGIAGGVSYDPNNRADWISGDVRLQRGIIDNSILVMLTTAINHRYERVIYFHNFDGSSSRFVSSALTDLALKGGLKVFVIKKFYAAAEIGAALTENPKSMFAETLNRKVRLLLSPSLGWGVGKRFDISARIENIQTAMFLRLGYTFLKSSN